ncbi:uncharacterized protein LOC115373567 [Myripristis murdjan]|uniref:uncharacterized protein LOC115373567 n=1 Tax=Myripristis murdjan TaxID=586833 RepID=UPI0011763E90|nr:uncharacterized protein LOC115373567 [Myripristis murdjan]
MFKIVEFLETNEVELVPGAWVKDNVCLWPALRGKALETAIKQQVSPGPDWMTWNIRVMFTTDNYQEGRQKVREAERRSDLQSDAEDCSGRKARRKTPSTRLQDGAHLTDSEDEAGPQQRNNGLPSAPQVSPPTYATLHPPMISHQSSASQSQNEMRHEVCQSPSSTYWNADQDHRTSVQWHHHFESSQGHQKQPYAWTMQNSSKSGSYSEMCARTDAGHPSTLMDGTPQDSTQIQVPLVPQQNNTYHSNPWSQPGPTPAWTPRAALETITSVHP